MTGRPRAALLLMALALVSCPQQTDPEGGPPTTGTEFELEVTSPAFEGGAEIPRKHSCEGDNVSPPLTWGGIPEESSALALILDDPDAPGATFYHWVVWGISPDTEGVAEGEVPEGGLQGRNDAGVTGYSGPCPPPPDDAHRYRFTLIAYRGELDPAEGAPARDVLEAASGSEIGRAVLTGLYDR